MCCKGWRTAVTGPGPDNSISQYRKRTGQPPPGLCPVGVPATEIPAKKDFANCNNKLSIQLARSLLFEEDPAQLRREP